MTSSSIRHTLAVLFICLIQVLVLNHIHLFHCATPLLIVYPMLFLPRRMPQWALLCTGFAIGLFIDMFTNTPGVGAASMTATALFRPHVLNVCMQHEDDEDVSPSRRLLGTASYLLYASLLTGMFCLMYFTLEAFGFFHWLHWLSYIAGSTVFTLALIMVIESIRKS